MKTRRQFINDEREDFIASVMAAGYTREEAERIVSDSEATAMRWREERGRPISEEHRRRLRDIRERMNAEVMAGMTE